MSDIVFYVLLTDLEKIISKYSAADRAAKFYADFDNFDMTAKLTEL